MKPPYAHLSRTLLVLVAAAGAVWLSAFFLPGAGVQPVPLLPVIGSVAGKVVAVTESHNVQKHEAAAHRTVAAPVLVRVPLRPPASVSQAVQTRPTPSVVHRTHRANRPHHAAKPKRSAPVQTAAPASAPATATSVSYTAAAHAPRGRAVGWHRKHEESITNPTAAPTHGHGKSHAKHDDAPSAQPAAVPAPAPAVPATPPPAAGHDNGKHRGDDHNHGDQGHGDQGHGPGGKK